MTGIDKSIKISGLIFAREIVGKGCQWVQVSSLGVMTFSLEINSDGVYKTLVSAEELYTLKVWALKYVNYYFFNGLTHISEDVRNQKLGWKKKCICMYVCPPSGEFPDPGIESTSLTSPSLTGEFFSTSATWEAIYIWQNAR